jgi:hypothetical protein
MRHQESLLPGTGAASGPSWSDERSKTVRPE